MKNQNQIPSIEEDLSLCLEEEYLEFPKEIQVASEREFQDRATSKKEIKNPKIGLFQSFNIKCKCGHEVFLYCSSEGCNSNFFICKDEQSPCFARHTQCFNSVIAKNFYQKLNSKVVNDPEYMEKIKKEIQKIIDKITDSVSDLNEKLQEKFKTFGLTDSQMMLIEKIKKKCTGEESSSLIKNSLFDDNPETPTGNYFSHFNTQRKNAELNWFSDSVKNFHNVVKSTRQYVESYFFDIENILVSIHAKYDKYTNFQKRFAFSKIFPLDLNDKSKNLDNLSNLEKMFKQNNIHFDVITKIFSHITEKSKQEVPLSFNYEKFCESIQGKSNLLFITTNVSGKSMGCYIPHKFSSQKGPLNIEGDKQRQPFFFSLSSNIYRSVDRTKLWIGFQKQSRLLSFGQESNFQKGEEKETFKILNFNFCIPNFPTVELILNEIKKEKKQHGLLFANQETTRKNVEDDVAYKELNGNIVSNARNIFSQSAPNIKFLEIYELTLKTEEQIEKEKTRLKQSTSSSIFGQRIVSASSNASSQKNLFASSNLSASSSRLLTGSIFCNSNPFAIIQDPQSQRAPPQRNLFEKQSTPKNRNPFSEKPKE